MYLFTCKGAFSESRQLIGKASDMVNLVVKIDQVSFAYYETKR